MSLYWEEFLYQSMFTTELIFYGLALLLSFFDLLLDIAESFGALIISSVIALNNLNLLGSAHTDHYATLNASSNAKLTLSIPTLFSINSLTPFILKSRHWLSF